MRLLANLGLLAAVWAASALPAPGADRPRVTVIGDSVQASFGFVPAATQRLGRGLDLRLDAVVCRRLVAPSCTFDGVTPEPALTLIQQRGSSLGPVVVINTGYNDDARLYDVPAVLGALRRAGVRAVVWVTLKESRPIYGASNAAIRAAARRSPFVRVADWNGLSAGRPWFGSDGLHLGKAGALALAGLLREHVLAAFASIGVPVGGPSALPPPRTIDVGQPIGTLAGDGGALWIAGGGRLIALDERTGAPLAPPASLAPGDELLSDGRRAWLRVGASGAIVRPATGLGGPYGRSLGTFGPQPALARSPTRLWVAAAGSLGALDPVTAVPLAAATAAAAPARIAAGRAALWALVPRGSSRASVEVRDPAGGALRRRIALPGATAEVLTATRRHAWTITGGDRLISVDATGRLRRAPAPVAAVVAGAGGQLWALAADRRGILRLDPATGRVLARARAPRRIPDAAGRMALTARHLWIVGGRPGSVERVPLG